MALIPGLQLPYGIQPVNALPVDSFSGPYWGSSTASAILLANTSVTSANRFQSMEIRLLIGPTTSNSVAYKYWYRNGILDTDLIEFSGGTSSVGTNGSSGTSGVSGTNGSSGTSGVSGTNGSSGTSGIGTNGSSGTSGINGVNGSSGTSGINGINGSSGTSGYSGTSGINGVNGSSGISGTSGIGTAGSSGTSGINGVNGSSGTSGINGINGSSGSSGTSGINGVNGSSGTSGTSGIGTAGSSGTSGAKGDKGDPGSGGLLGSVVAYRIKVNMLAGSIDATTPIAKVWAPGNVEIYDSVTGWTISNWSIVKSSGNLTLTHPLGKPVLMGTTTALNLTNLITKAIVGTSASQNAIVNTESNTSVQFTGITGILTGGATSGAAYIIITFFVES